MGISFLSSAHHRTKDPLKGSLAIMLSLEVIYHVYMYNVKQGLHDLSYNIPTIPKVKAYGNIQ